MRAPHDTPTVELLAVPAEALRVDGSPAGATAANTDDDEPTVELARDAVQVAPTVEQTRTVAPTELDATAACERLGRYALAADRLAARVTAAPTDASSWPAHPLVPFLLPHWAAELVRRGHTAEHVLDDCLRDERLSGHAFAAVDRGDRIGWRCAAARLVVEIAEHGERRWVPGDDAADDVLRIGRAVLLRHPHKALGRIARAVAAA